MIKKCKCSNCRRERQCLILNILISLFFLGLGVTGFYFLVKFIG